MKLGLKAGDGHSSEERGAVNELGLWGRIAFCIGSTHVYQSMHLENFIPKWFSRLFVTLINKWQCLERWELCCVVLPLNV